VPEENEAYAQAQSDALFILPWPLKLVVVMPLALVIMPLAVVMVPLAVAVMSLIVAVMALAAAVMPFAVAMHLIALAIHVFALVRRIFAVAFFPLVGAFLLVGGHLPGANISLFIPFHAGRIAASPG
jgi:hypothetical protein